MWLEFGAPFARVRGVSGFAIQLNTMKKKSTKPAKSPAPATNAAKNGKPKARPTLSTAPTSPVAPAPVMVPPAAPTVVPPVPAAAVKPVTSKPVETKIIAQIDVGYGNELYVRGDGAGLSWNQGRRMQCVANDRWEIALGESSRPISFKLLLNDQIWCTGPDSTVESGATATITPDFA